MRRASISGGLLSVLDVSGRHWGLPWEAEWGKVGDGWPAYDDGRGRWVAAEFDLKIDGLP